MAIKPNDKVLVTFPGKMGDLLFTMPLIAQMKRQYGCSIDLLTSRYCDPLLPLLNLQEQIEIAMIDKKYTILSDMFGIQPSDMSEPDRYSHIFHLGFVREIIGNPLAYPHLIELHYHTLRKRYGVEIDVDYDLPYLRLGSFHSCDIVFNGYAESIFEQQRTMKYGEWVNGIWKEVLDYYKGRVTIVTDEARRSFHEQFGAKIVVTKNLLETARFINGSKLFLGVQSCPYVIADGLQKKRLIFSLFKHVLPVGKDGHVFGLEADATSVIEKIEMLLSESQIVFHCS